MEKQLKVLIGVPGSGKSTKAKEFEKEGFYLVPNLDHLRETLPNAPKLKNYSKTFEKEIKTLFKKSVESELIKGTPKVLVDNTHLIETWINFYRELCGKYSYKLDLHYLDDSMNLELCHQRNTYRERTVPWIVLENMYQLYAKNWLSRQRFVLTPGAKPCIIVDIDGTVANCDGVRDPFDFSNVELDTPHNDIIELVHLLAETNEVIFLSGRDGACFEETDNWLKSHIKVPYQLYLRTADDMRKDWLIKFELFNEHINGKYSVKYVLDDRLQVVRFWRAMGLRVLQVAPGLF